MQDNAVTTAADLERKVHALAQSGKFREAAETCDRLNHQFPDYVSGWLTASSLALEVNEPNIAIRAIDRALALSPGKPELLLQKLICLGNTGAIEKARALGERLGTHDFPDAERSTGAGIILSRIGLHELANRQFERAALLKPASATNHYNLATTLRFLGRLQEAEQRLDRALDIDPNDSEAHILRSGLRKQTWDSNHIEQLSSAILRESNDADRVRLGFALAKEHEDLGEYDSAFAALSDAAALRRKGLKYTPQRELDTIQRIREVFDADVLKRGGGHVNAAPIFVAGMPRTGTTLADRILGNHPVVRSAGELHNFALELQKLCQKTFNSLPSAPADLVGMAAEIDFEALGETYISSTRGYAGDAPHFVDKMPLNFLYFGLIHLALPNAKIVLLQRDPMDTCFAVFKTLFESAYAYSYDIEELGNYFVEYHRLTQHWIDCLGDRIHVVRYEELVSEERPVIEGLLDYCGLTHDAACFNFQDNPEPTTTASASQVRSNLHTRSVGLWRNYETQLAPLRDILAAAGVVDAD